MPKRYKVKEIFGPTLQGEGSLTGMPTLFLRFSACNRWSGKKEDQPKAACWFCDTDFVGGEMMYPNDIIREMKKLSSKVKNVVITGGEPTLQLDKELLLELKAAEYFIALETNGSKDITEYFELIDHISMSPKQPIEETNLIDCDDIKILFPEAINRVTPESFAIFSAKHRYLQPVWKENEGCEEALGKCIDFLYQNPDWRLSYQNHKTWGLE